jgi:hypothetical protein
VNVERSHVEIVLVSTTTHLCRDASACTRIPTESRDEEFHAMLMIKEQVSVKEIFGGFFRALFDCPDVPLIPA